MRRAVKVMRVSYPDIRIPQWQGRKLRGFFGLEGKEESLLHNHTEDGNSVYRYPLVQYKVIRGVPTILAMEEGIPAIYPLVMEQDSLRLGDQILPCGNIEFDLRNEMIGDRETVIQYRFISPWFALNQNNYRAYQHAGPEEQKELLTKIMTGNILSLAKGMDLTVENRLTVTTDVRNERALFKNDMVAAFWGRRGTGFNQLIPDYNTDICEENRISSRWV